MPARASPRRFESPSYQAWPEEEHCTLMVVAVDWRRAVVAGVCMLKVVYCNGWYAVAMECVSEVSNCSWLRRLASRLWECCDYYFKERLLECKHHKGYLYIFAFRVEHEIDGFDVALFTTSHECPPAEPLGKVSFTFI